MVCLGELLYVSVAGEDAEPRHTTASPPFIETRCFHALDYVRGWLVGWRGCTVCVYSVERRYNGGMNKNYIRPFSPNKLPVSPMDADATMRRSGNKKAVEYAQEWGEARYGWLVGWLG